jgi:nitrogen fixation NifU-like protein
MYSEKVMEHFTNPRNIGEIADADGVGEVGNAKCGDIMKIFLKIENNIIKDIKFQTYGCGAAIATSSIATEMLLGKSLEYAVALKNQDVVNELGGLPAAKVHCSVLAEEAVKSAVADYYRRNNMPVDFEAGCNGCCGSCGLTEDSE